MTENENQEANVLHEFFVAGVKFHELHTVIKEVETGERLTLEPEPTNPYDPNAVRIYRGEVMLGFVPKKFSAEVTAEIEIGSPYCVVTEVTPSAKPWNQLKVRIEEGGDA